MTIMPDEFIKLGHGSGGKLSQALFQRLFKRYFKNPVLDQHTDSAILPWAGDHLAFTTDSYVVNPIFFPNASIGTLAVCGTVNDLAVVGATPLYISAAFVIEEGFAFSDLEVIVADMAAKAKEAQVTIVAGDTKVVEKGACDRIFISTSGVGVLKPEHADICTGRHIRACDKIIINGSIADHGMAIFTGRSHYIQTDIVSDCAPLNHLIADVLSCVKGVHFMRDATRGGLATVLCECMTGKHFGILIDEDRIPVKENVKGLCDIMGFDPLYIANEGKVVMVVKESDAEKVIGIMKKHEIGKDGIIIGEVVDHHPGKVWVQTSVGGRRILEMLSGDQLPRIC
jgi:hydrogenase expression/formation protein HypE